MPAEAAKSKPEPLLIKRYASRRLYNTETSDYITLEEIAHVVRAGREVRIVDLRSGDDLTRQYLLQIIADHESRGENVLPVDLLTDLVRSYTAQAQSVVPQFLAASFEMLRNGQSKAMEQLVTLKHPMASMPGFSEMQRQQQLFLKAMMGGWTGPAGDAARAHDDDEAPDQTAGQPVPQPEARPARGKSRPSASSPETEAEDIRRQLAELQTRISKL